MEQDPGSNDEISTETPSEADQPKKSRDVMKPKSLELTDHLRENLKEFPEVIELIEKLQKTIEKQIKKIIKWKAKAKGTVKKKGVAVATQTDFVLQENGLDQAPQQETSLADDIRRAAEEVVQSQGLVYEETSGLYYDYNSGYYYNAEYGLYYDGTSGTYLKYNQETQSYEYHSQVETEVVKTKDYTQKRRKNKKTSKTKVNSLYSTESLTSSFSNLSLGSKRARKHCTRDVEDGECSESSSSSTDQDSLVSESSDMCKQWPPCMRLIVESTEIPRIKLGSLFIITCDGGTVGREGVTHSICLPDINVSKHHLKVSYDGERYMIVDLGSRNGTMLNGKRISSSKQESEPVEVEHGSKIQLGSTVFLCHIHEGSQTCGHCEPGLLIAEEKDSVLPKKSINQQYKSELKRLRKQHGFIGSNEDTSKLSEGYTDRAQKRREEVGSQNPYEKTKTASLDESIPVENKGFKLLSKMGWKAGESLGKDGTGVKEPIKLVSNVGTSGMGATINEVPAIKGSAKGNIWKKTQERFEKLPDKSQCDSDLEED